MDESDRLSLLAQSEICRLRAEQTQSAHDRLLWLDIAERLAEFVVSRTPDEGHH